MPSGIILNYRRLRRSPLSVWLVMILATFLPIFAVFVLVEYNRTCFAWCPEPDIGLLALRAAAITAPLAIIGLCVGGWRSSSATRHVSKAFDVQYLGEAHELTQRVHRLADQLSLPHPAVGLMAVTNAFAVGDATHNSAVIIGEPLLRRLAPDELDAVIGHELGHIAAGDTNRMNIVLGYQSFLDWLLIAIGNLFSMTALIAGSVASRIAGDVRTGSYVSRGMVVIVQFTMNLCATLAARGFSRRREYYADAIGAALTSSDAMQRALMTIHGFADKATGREKDYKMLMFRGFGGTLFATHPLLANRLYALRQKTVLHKIERLAEKKQGGPKLPSSTRRGEGYGRAA
jgi:Zn-dependent protease with chaperone function